MDKIHLSTKDKLILVSQIQRQQNKQMLDEWWWMIRGCGDTVPRQSSPGVVRIRISTQAEPLTWLLCQCTTNIQLLVQWWETESRDAESCPIFMTPTATLAVIQRETYVHKQCVTLLHMAHLFKERVRTATQCACSPHASKWPPTTSSPAKRCTIQRTCRLLPLKYVLCYLMLRTHVQLSLAVDIFKPSHLHIIQRDISKMNPYDERQPFCLWLGTSGLASEDRALSTTCVCLVTIIAYAAAS